ncbi:GNAT family N-acetyltransferase [Emticicia sp. CRIBPO]|uniref:GNAT family N-acetyltransferase n=1 Tax=Emticicia sp. CRIBPO TaxID=2683258 RepID=UPI0014124697|nr:GNAT family N-acetyltransferase [Emticicia sp. CRIBPO]
MEITYQIEKDLSVQEFIDCLKSSTLAERRPMEDTERLALMVRNADIMITARYDGQVVGVARSVTDYAFTCYLSDLAVDQAFQGKGIGKELMRQTANAVPGVKVHLMSAPAAIEFYEKLPIEKWPHCYRFTDQTEF